MAGGSGAGAGYAPVPARAPVPAYLESGEWKCMGGRCYSRNPATAEYCRTCSQQKPFLPSATPWTCNIGYCGEQNVVLALNCSSCHQLYNPKTSTPSPLVAPTAASGYGTGTGNAAVARPVVKTKLPGSSVLSGEPWQCIRCGTDNPAWALNCKGCRCLYSSDRSLPATLPVTGGAGAGVGCLPAQELRVASKWLCSVCTMLNKPEDPNCDACTASRK